jgi:hypothetical protein
MVDHVVLAAMATLRQCFSARLLERQGPEDRLQVDLLLGDLTFETSYSLPFEGRPPRVRADIGLEWPTWSQSAYRSWVLGEPVDEQPELLIQVVVRVQRLYCPPDVDAIVAATKPSGPTLSGEEMERSRPTLEHVMDPAGEDDVALEITYDGACRLDEQSMANPGLLESEFDGLAQFVAETLVTLSDLGLDFRPPDDESDRS